ncbi:Transcription factor IIIC [Penicillium brevicompactum]
MKAAAGISDDHVCHVLGRRKFVPDDNSWQIYDISGGLLQGIMKTTHFFHLSRRFPAANRAESYPSKYRENAQIGRTLCGQNAFDRRNLATIDTLAEWLTRGPAKPVSSEAQAGLLSPFPRKRSGNRLTIGMSYLLAWMVVGSVDEGSAKLAWVRWSRDTDRTNVATKFRRFDCCTLNDHWLTDEAFDETFVAVGNPN